MEATDHPTQHPAPKPLDDASRDALVKMIQDSGLHAQNVCDAVERSGGDLRHLAEARECHKNATQHLLRSIPQ